MIEINSLTKIYRSLKVIDIQKLEIKSGESIGLIGKNGAGKTTLFRLMLDLARPDSGSISINGEQVTGNENWKTYVAAYLDENFLIEYLTPEEYFYFVGSLQQKPKNEVNQFLTQFHDFFNNEILNTGKYIRELSKGNKTKIGIAASFLQQPEILILDEPFANIDPSSQFRLIGLLKNLNKKGATLLISSHDLNHVTEISSRIILMEKGIS